jgi:uncharacterized protein (DUF1330 family)
VSIPNRGEAVYVDPTPEDIRRLLAEDEPPFLTGVGATVLFAGDCSTRLVAPDGHDWDALLVVRYPSREAFLQMVTDPDYQVITRMRTEGLEAAVLQATQPWG